MNYTFKEFLMVWFQVLLWDMPSVQAEVADFLDDGDWGNLSKVLMLWRGLGKSTIVDCYVAYRLSKQPSLRFLILSADKETAKKSTLDILSVIRRHPLCDHIVPDTKKQIVRADQFWIPGATDERNASVRCFGITSNVTGGRADIIIYDDVEVQKNSGTDGKREDLRRRISESTHLLTPENGQRLFIGTYHDWNSIYDEQIANKASTLKVPVLTDTQGSFPNITGTYTWPERFGEQIMLQKQRDCSSLAEFNSQYLLIPSTIEDSLLDPDMISVYDDEMDYSISNGNSVLTIGKTRMVSVSAWWDPAGNGAKRDDSVLAIVFSDGIGNKYIHRTIKLVGDAIQQCQQVRKYLEQYCVPTIHIESNGPGDMLPDLMIRELNDSKYLIGVVKKYVTGKKNDRILEALDTPLLSGLLHAHRSVIDGPFYSQLRDFEYNKTRKRDDYVDAVASAVGNEPNRVAAFTPRNKSGFDNWLGGNGGFEMQRDQFQF